MQDPKKIHQAAADFEALLIGQLMKAAKEASSGDAVFGGDGASESLFDLAGQQLSQVLAKNGGFGLSKLIESGLRAKANGGGASIPDQGNPKVE